MRERERQKVREREWSTERQRLSRKQSKNQRRICRWRKITKTNKEEEEINEKMMEEELGDQERHPEET